MTLLQFEGEGYWQKTYYEWIIPTAYIITSLKLYSLHNKVISIKCVRIYIKEEITELRKY